MNIEVSVAVRAQRMRRVVSLAGGLNYGRIRWKRDTSWVFTLLAGDDPPSNVFHGYPSSPENRREQPALVGRGITLRDNLALNS